VVGAGAQDAVDDRRHAQRLGPAPWIAPEGVVISLPTQLSSFTRSTRALTWIHLTFLLAVTLMPFSTGLLAQDTTYRLSMAVYWLNLFALGVMLFISVGYADRAGLLSDATTAEMRAALERRIVVYQALYALAALTCLINTYLAIGLLVALQLNSVIAPRIGILDRA
jgi:uncharacterized membrane protein